jgi:hypothetical protein
MGTIDRLILCDQQWDRIAQHIIGNERTRGSSLALDTTCPSLSHHSHRLELVARLFDSTVVKLGPNNYFRYQPVRA